MKIAQVSPLFERVPPKGYGGTERVISYLTEELVRLGHDVTLFATGDSITAAQLVAAVGESLRQDELQHEWMAYHTIQMDMVAELAHTFDIIHFHCEYLHYPLAKLIGTPSVTTVHGRQDRPGLDLLYRRFRDVPVISISDSQRAPLPTVNWCGTVYHGLPPDLYRFEPHPGNYFAFIGRVSPEKRLDRAIEIARGCGVPLYVGAKIDTVDEPYFNECIKPLLRDPLVTFAGEISEHEKRELLQHASALLFPIDWPEPFGLVMIEAFACGTPVVAYRNGSIPEVMEEGVTGHVVTNQEAAVRAASGIGSIDRKGCRQTFERRFTVARMAEHYLRIYRQVLSSF
jgi:glycosyltransferase involved in cell wall biosynthesis